MNCPKCHAAILKNLSACPHCGKQMIESTPRHRKRLGILIFLSALFLAIFILVASLIKEETPQHVVEEQLSSITNNQMTQAYYAYT